MTETTPENAALWLPKRGARFELGPAPYTAPAAGEVVVRVRAIAVNPIDGMPGFAYRLILPWLNFPAVVGSDVAGVIVEVGPGVTRLRPGDRVVGAAGGIEQNRNRAAEGAFQRYVVLKQSMTATLPDDLSFEQAAVLPLAVSTAASGMFQHDHLALPLPTIDAEDRRETVLVWGGSTSVGSNAIQLARHAGYRVVATASPRNFDYLRSLGATATVDYHNRTAADELIDAIGDSPLAGTLAIGNGSLKPTLTIASAVPGSRRIASAQPALLTRVSSLLRRHKGIQVSSIWGGSLKDNEVGPGIYVDFLPAALAKGTYQAVPNHVIVGAGLDKIPDALDQLRKGVSAKKLVVTI
ncbi:Zn-dependent oxidoreductase [Amycolatopsis antarctica]|uniref:Zn-dependent oxidoreductase n=1 Tax=Amycolatopsis antarctica TaxID=1854586 RepID=A0A263CWB0_9PSEU|nr:zinc-binding alcohol dehydrogenase family protein [Amycolatopsis antarctica]OZM70381.1 Zn-dependent oxidoreductase [Amycolatopsis antarctica]